MLVIKVYNDGNGNLKIGHYDWIAFINHQEVGRGRIENHHRIKGWEELVRRLAEQVTKEQAKEAFDE